MSDPATSKLGKYELVERLGIGGMAELYKAQIIGEHGFKKLVAIKKILPNLVANPAFVGMFVDEARITALLEHPNIVQVFEFGQEGEELYLVMQLVDGFDLLDLLRKGKKHGNQLPVELAAYIAHQILEALDYAHNARDQEGKPLGIIHRDISPGNVLVSRRGNVMLTDFGIAWAYERHQKTEAGKLKGKFGYMSPEQVAGAKLDARSDIFSTGVLLAEMLINRHLFVGPSDLEVLLMVRDAELGRLYKYGAHVPPDLMNILRKALARRPDKRFETAAAFRDALADWLFSRGMRVSSADLASFMGRIEAAAQARALAQRKSAPELSKTPAPLTLSGPDTRQHRLDAVRVADAARAKLEKRARSLPTIPAEDMADAAEQEESTRVYERSASPPRIDTSSLESTMMPRNDTTSAEPTTAWEFGASSRAAEPSGRGDFAELSPLAVLYDIGDREASGLLVVEGRAGTLKEAYFRGGNPEFVMSNVRSERLGDYLIAKQVISEDERDRAVEVMPHFAGHILDAMIALGFMEPLDALRRLSQQVRDKLIDVCTWQKGKYRWYEGRDCPWPARKLHLDTFEIVAAGAFAIEVPAIVNWAKLIRDKYVHLVATQVELDRFGLGAAMARMLLVDGTTTVAELAGRVAVPEERLEFLRILHLLVQCGLVTVH